MPGITGFDPVSGAVIDSATFAITWRIWTKGATAYHFQMDNNGDFGSPEYDLMLSGAAFASESPVPEGKYYWRVAVVQNSLSVPGRLRPRSIVRPTRQRLLSVGPQATNPITNVLGIKRAVTAQGYGHAVSAGREKP